MQRALLQTFSRPSTLARVGVSRLGTVLGGKVEAPSFASEISASLDSELAAPDLDRHIANTVKVLAVAISLSTPHIFGMREVLATYFAYSLSMQQVSFSLDTGTVSRRRLALSSPQLLATVTWDLSPGHCQVLLMHSTPSIKFVRSLQCTSRIR
jgi:hypothetical protein